MSMNTYGGMRTGIVIKKELIDEFLKKYIELRPEHFEEEDISLKEKIEDLEADLCCCGRLIKSSAKDKDDVFYAEIFDDEPYYNTTSIYHLRDMEDWYESLDLPFILVYTDKDLLTKNVLEGKYYKTKEEMIEEFKAKLGRYLPEDFDYEGNIGDVEYALFC